MQPTDSALPNCQSLIEMLGATISSVLPYVLPPESQVLLRSKVDQIPLELLPLESGNVVVRLERQDGQFIDF